MMKISNKLRSQCFEVCTYVGKWITPVLNDPYVQQNYMGTQVKIIRLYLDKAKVTDINFRNAFCNAIEESARASNLTTSTLSPLNLYVNLCVGTLTMLSDSLEDVQVRKEIEMALNSDDWQGFIQYVMDVAAHVSQKVIGGNLLKPGLKVKDIEFLMGR